MTIHRLALCTLLVAGCTDMSDDDLSSTEQDVTWSQLQHIDCSVSNCYTPPGKVIGPAGDRTCFLAGMSGKFFDQNIYTNVNIQIDAATNQWVLRSGPWATGVDVACINTIANRATASGFAGISGDGSQYSTDGLVGGTNSPQRRCFLSGFDAYTQIKTSGTYADNFEVYKDGLGVWHAHADVYEHAQIDAFAVCVDVPTLVSAPAFGHNTTGSTTGVLYPTAANVSCGLTQINGALESYDATAPMGVEISYQSGVYLWTFNERVGATAACVK